ncbi:MAG TPA: hypothetical protein DCS07_05510 [Bdellovibrionales bacterium]|nr:MAG: hypothetical protein A2X97_12915 [Bdellovibrionales bacterium GWA1_52_35]OFZ39659.1 MAG: hypothetical protein A2070_02070 [Bdellovibrionales bacterium GWC1_52_8]HAR42076.1 hypothetical protein [Bdellovibrionales bacterium]HCM39925.1 hypothetical protein [Bdellovibrionales bacterium]
MAGRLTTSQFLIQVIFEDIQIVNLDPSVLEKLQEIQKQLALMGQKLSERRKVIQDVSTPAT